MISLRSMNDTLFFGDLSFGGPIATGKEIRRKKRNILDSINGLSLRYSSICGPKVRRRIVFGFLAGNVVVAPGSLQNQKNGLGDNIFPLHRVPPSDR